MESPFSVKPYPSLQPFKQRDSHEIIYPEETIEGSNHGQPSPLQRDKNYFRLSWNGEAQSLLARCLKFSPHNKKS